MHRGWQQPCGDADSSPGLSSLQGIGIERNQIDRPTLELPVLVGVQQNSGQAPAHDAGRRMLCLASGDIPAYLRKPDRPVAGYALRHHDFLDGIRPSDQKRAWAPVSVKQPLTACSVPLRSVVGRADRRDANIASSPSANSACGSPTTSGALHNRSPAPALRPPSPPTTPCRRAHGRMSEQNVERFEIASPIWYLAKKAHYFADAQLSRQCLELRLQGGRCP